MKFLSWKLVVLPIAFILLGDNNVLCFNNTTTKLNATSFVNSTTDLGITREAVFVEGGCDFEVDFCTDWINDEKRNDFDWMRKSGRTPSSGTGPKRDRTGVGSYVYAETSWPRRPGETARLVGGPFSGIMCMRFFYHMYGRHVADLQIYLREAGMESFVWGRYKNQGNAWRFTNVTVFGNNYTIVFVARVGKSYQGDIAVDDITFVNGTCDGKELNYVPRVYNSTVLQAIKRGEPGTCNFDGGFCEWINLPLGDQFDWTLQSGKTATMSTGPDQDHTGYDGAYIFIESSEPQRHRDVAQLLGPRLCGTMCLQFYYHMKGTRMGTLNVYKREGMKNDDLLWTMSGHQGEDWQEAIVETGGACYQIIFEGVVGPGFQSDIAVDDMYFVKGSCCHLKQESFDASLIGNCTFEEGMCQWINDPNDDFDWQLIEGGTPSEGTGPKAGYNGGQYLYVESSEPRSFGDRATLVSGVLKGLQCMRFMYYMHGQDMGYLSVYRFGDGVMKTRLWRRNGDQGDMWNEARITLPCNSTSYMLQIEAVIGVWRSDIAIDNIVFTKGACPPITRVLTPPTTPPPITSTPTIPAHLLSENNCSFASHFCSWINDNTDDFDWLRNSGGTTTLDTGPSSDAGGDGGYIYIEASLHTNGQKARLLTSGYITGTQCLRFKYHMMGAGIGTLRVQQITRKGLTPKVVWYRIGYQGEDWKGAEFNLFGKLYKISIEGERGPSFNGDIAVDSISFTPGSCVTIVSEEEIQADSHLGLGVCSFDDGFCQWRNEATEDQFDWSITEGETPSKGTGPTAGFGGSGKYAFIEASSPRRPGDKAILKIYGSGEDRCLYFAYQMSGTGIGSLSVYRQELGRGELPVLVWIRSGDHGQDWRQAEIDIKGYSQYKLMVQAVRSQNYRGDISIDEIGFHKGPCGKQSQSAGTRAS